MTPLPVPTVTIELSPLACEAVLRHIRKGLTADALNQDPTAQALWDAGWEALDVIDTAVTRD